MSDDNGTDALPDFSQLSELRVEGKRAWFTIGKSMPGAKIEGACAHPSVNLDYSAAKMEASALSYPRDGEKAAAALARNRVEDFDLFAELVLTAWDGVVNVKGEPVPFTKRNAAALLRALPSDVFDAMRAFFIQPGTFRRLPDVAAVAGNSSAGSSGN